MSLRIDIQHDKLQMTANGQKLGIRLADTVCRTMLILLLFLSGKEMEESSNTEDDDDDDDPDEHLGDLFLGTKPKETEDETEQPPTKVQKLKGVEETRDVDESKTNRKRGSGRYCLLCIAV